MAQSELLISTAGTTAENASAEEKAGARHYSLLVTRDSEEVLAAQRLRYQVFAQEMGASLPNDADGIDADAFDEFCDHLVVRDDHSGEIVGGYRMLPPDAAQRAGSLYADYEFDLRSLSGLRSSLVETGRSCVHADHRTGAVIGLVWAGISRYMLLSGHSYLAGCASVPLHDGGELAAGVWDVVSTKHYAPEEYRVRPLRAWDTEAAPRPRRRVLPPLLRGYLRLGAWVCGPPALDAEFNVADFFVLLPMDRVDQRYLRYFLGDAG
jgi:putative hemolysin